MEYEMKKQADQELLGFGYEMKKQAEQELLVFGPLQPVHSQVRKIKQEDEKVEDLYLRRPELIRPVIREMTRSPSPLGRPRQAISVGEF